MIMPKYGVSGAPYPAIDEVGVVRGLIEGFVEPLREPLTAFTLLEGRERREGHWGLETIEWREISDFGPSVVSMDIPEVRSDSSTHKRRRVEMPIWTKDLVMGGRKWRQYIETGLSPQEVPQLARSMARDLNEFFLYGTDEALPGPDVGLLNHDGVGLSTATAPWDDAKVINRDLHKTASAIMSRRYRGSHDFVIEPERADIFGEFIGDTNVRIGENLPGTIDRVLFQEDLKAPDEATKDNIGYLINKTPGAYEAMSPLDEGPWTFGMGNITVGAMDPLGDFNPLDLGGGTQEDLDDFMHSRVLRYLNITTLRLIRTGDESPVQAIEFDHEAEG